VNSAAISRDNTILITASDDTLKIWDFENNKLLSTIDDTIGHSDRITFVKFSQDGNIFVTASEDWTMKIWDSLNYELLQTLDDHTETVNGIEFSIDGKYMITCGDDSFVKIWDIQQEFKIINSIKDESNAMLKCVNFSNDGSLFGTSSDKLVKIYNTKTK
jgi:WD40 repeat protein